MLRCYVGADYEKYLSNPDRIVRDLFTSREDAIPFLRAYLPAELVGILDLEKLEYGQGSYIDPRMQEHRTDILFHIPTLSGVPTRLVLLFEHKSQVTKATYAQILRYLANIYENEIKSLTPVIPFLFYHHSRGSFRPVRSFAELFNLPEAEGSILQKYIPDFQVELFHLASEDPERVRAHLHLYAFLRILRHVDIGDISNHFPQVLKVADEVFRQEKGLEELMKLVLYILKRSEVPVEEIHSRVEPFGPWIQEEIMTTYEKLIEKGKKEGREAGIMEGESRGKLESARRMLEEGDPIDKVLRITGLTEDDLRQAGLIQ